MPVFNFPCAKTGQLRGGNATTCRRRHAGAMIAICGQGSLFGGQDVRNSWEAVEEMQAIATGSRYRKDSGMLMRMTGCNGVWHEITRDGLPYNRIALFDKQKCSHSIQFVGCSFKIIPPSANTGFRITPYSIHFLYKINMRAQAIAPHSKWATNNRGGHCGGESIIKSKNNPDEY